MKELLTVSNSSPATTIGIVPGGALGFNGINQYIEVPDNGKLNPSGNVLTISANVHPTNRNDQVIVQKWSSGNQYSLEINGGKVTFKIAICGKVNVVSSAFDISTEGPTEIMATYDGVSMYIFEDNGSGFRKTGEKGSVSGNLDQGTGHLIIGKSSTTNTNYFTGTMSAISLYATTFTEVDLRNQFPNKKGFIENWMFGFESQHLFNLPNVPAVCSILQGRFINYNSEVVRSELDMTYQKYISVENSASINITSALTLACDIKLTDRSNSALIHKWGGSHSQYSLEINNQKPCFVIKIGDVIKMVYSSAVVPVNEWVRIVGTYDANKMRIYVNGTEMGSTPATGHISIGDGKLMVGRRSDSSRLEGSISGSIGTVQILDVRLTPEQINGTHPILPTSSKLLFDNYKVIPQVPDDSGNENTGTLHN